jgi:AhpD family alkylhydroperoxidase
METTGTGPTKPYGVGRGRDALTEHAPSAAAALDTMVGATWAAAETADLVDLVDLAARVVARPHALTPVPRPTGLGASPWDGRPVDEWRSFSDLTDQQRVACGFAEQFCVDVSTIDDDQRAAVGAALGAATGDVVQGTYVLDFVPRVRAALDALFGPSDWPTVGVVASDGGLWGAIDGYLHVVPGLEGLDPVTTELVRLRGASQHQCRLCLSLRSRPALLAGADDHDFQAVDRYETSDLSPAAKAALAYTDAMVWVPGRIAPDVAADVRAHFDDAQCVELVLDIARNATNKIAVAFAADTPHVTEGYEIYEVTADGEIHYDLSLDEAG